MNTLSGILGDVRFAIRSLRRSPGFVLIAVITLGTGIGANTSTFSIPNEVLLRPLPYPDSGQLDRIYRATPQNSRGGVSPADYLDVKPQMSGYGEIAAYVFSEMNLSEPGQPAEEGEFPEPTGIDGRAQSLAGHDDLPVGFPDGDRVGGPTPHQDAFDHGLAAIEEGVLFHGSHLSRNERGC